MVVEERTDLSGCLGSIAVWHVEVNQDQSEGPKFRVNALLDCLDCLETIVAHIN